MKKLPFLFTPPIERYIKEITTEFRKRAQGTLPNQTILPFSMHFETYKDDEPFMSNSEDMRSALIDYLKVREAVKFEFVTGAWDSRTVYDTNIPDDTNSSMYFDKEFGLQILKIEPILELFEYHKKHPFSPMLEESDASESYELKYDKKTGVLTFYNERRAFHEHLRPLVNELWSHRSHLYLGMDVGNRKYVSLVELANSLNMNTSFGKKMIHGQLKNLRSSLPKKFPIHIEIGDEAILMNIKEV